MGLGKIIKNLFSNIFGSSSPVSPSENNNTVNNPIEESSIKPEDLIQKTEAEEPEKPIIPKWKVILDKKPVEIIPPRTFEYSKIVAQKKEVQSEYEKGLENYINNTYDKTYLYHTATGDIKGEYLKPTLHKSFIWKKGGSSTKEDYCVVAYNSPSMAYARALSHDKENSSKVLYCKSINDVPIVIMSNKELIENNPKGKIVIIPDHGFKVDGFLRSRNAITSSTQHTLTHKIPLKHCLLIDNITPEIAMEKGVQVLFASEKLTEPAAWENFSDSLRVDKNGKFLDDKQRIDVLRKKIEDGELIHYNAEKGFGGITSATDDQAKTDAPVRVKEKEHPFFDIMPKIDKETAAQINEQIRKEEENRRAKEEEFYKSQNYNTTHSLQQVQLFMDTLLREEKLNQQKTEIYMTMKQERSRDKSKGMEHER